MKIKKLLSVICLITLSLSLSGCSVTNEFLAKLGFDTHDYEGEKVTATHTADSEYASQLSLMVYTLSLNNPEVPCFSGTKEAVSVCRDSLLNYLLNRNYSKYTGNLELLDKASKAYPYLKVSVIIPAEEFEDAAYRYFGGKQKISNESGQLFTYLDKVNAYTTVSTSVESQYEVVTVSLEETENTFRYCFYCKLDDSVSPDYFALIIKRSDSTCYFKYIKEAKTTE